MRALLIPLLLVTALWLPAARSAPGVGDKAPALKGTLFDGASFDLAAQKGRVVVLNLWATWCSPCRAEMPLLDAFYKKYQARGVLVLGLSEDDPDGLATAKQVMAGFTYPALLAAAAPTDDYPTPRVLPVTYIIGVDGVIRAKLWAGDVPVTEANLEQAILPLLPAPHP